MRHYRYYVCSILKLFGTYLPNVNNWAENLRFCDFSQGAGGSYKGAFAKSKQQRSYKAYTLNDYRSLKMVHNLESTNDRSLGPNMSAEEYKEKVEKWLFIIRFF